MFCEFARDASEWHMECICWINTCTILNMGITGYDSYTLYSLALFGQLCHQSHPVGFYTEKDNKSITIVDHIWFMLYYIMMNHNELLFHWFFHIDLHEVSWYYATHKMDMPSSTNQGKFNVENKTPRKCALFIFYNYKASISTKLTKNSYECQCPVRNDGHGSSLFCTLFRIHGIGHRLIHGPLENNTWFV